jgi:hypothetical protein
MLRRVIAVGALVFGLSVGAAIPAGASSVSPQKWAPKFCTIVSDWQSTISSKAGDLTSAVSSVTDLETARNEIESFLLDMVNTTDDAITAIKAAGTPSSANGGKIVQRVISGFKDAKRAFDRAKTKASLLSTSDPSAFRSEGQQIGDDLTAAGDKIGSKLDGIKKLDKDHKLEAAVKKSKACSVLNQSSG